MSPAYVAEKGTMTASVASTPTDWRLLVIAGVSNSAGATGMYGTECNVMYSFTGKYRTVGACFLQQYV